MSAHPGTEERVVLLSEDGQPIGDALKSEVHHTDTPLHLAFSCYVLDDAGRLLVTRRAWSKLTWPGAWTNSCCGHPGPGEPLPDAVRRRVGEELGLVLDELRLVLPRFSYRAVMADGTVEHELCPVFVATTSGPLRPDPEEVADAVWEPWSEFRSGVLAGRDVSPWCREQVAQLPADPLAAGEADAANLPPAAR